MDPTRRRLVIDLDGAFFVWCGTYVCTRRREAGQRPYQFNSYDADSLKYLPRFLRAKFPAVLTRRAAISTKVLDQLVCLVLRKFSFGGFRSALREQHLSRLASHRNQCRKGN